LGFETLASACVIDTENNKSFIEIGKERLDVPALIKNCCELGRAKESFIACFSNGNQCVEVNSNTELSSLANCDSRSRVGKLTWLLNVLKGKPGQSLALQRDQGNESILGMPKGDVLASHNWKLPKLDKIDSSAYRFVITKDNITIISSFLANEINLVDISSLAPNTMYKWQVQDDAGNPLHEHQFYFVSTNEVPQILSKHLIEDSQQQTQTNEKISLALRLYDEGFEFNALQILLFL
tara:strand:- start:3180 stop:3893 length:714 start_codon:yes stop_codon:yes gene_type:complete